MKSRFHLDGDTFKNAVCMDNLFFFFFENGKINATFSKILIFACTGHSVFPQYMIQEEIKNEI